MGWDGDKNNQNTIEHILKKHLPWHSCMAIKFKWLEHCLHWFSLGLFIWFCRISVTFVYKDGEEKTIKVPIGMSMLEAAHENGIDLEGKFFLSNRFYRKGIKGIDQSRKKHLYSTLYSQHIYHIKKLVKDRMASPEGKFLRHAILHVSLLLNCRVIICGV